MSESHATSRSLSEIGHLFLSSVRERQTNGAPLPKRQPPGRPAPSARLEVSVDLTPEEFAHVCGTAGLGAIPHPVLAQSMAAPAPMPAMPVTSGRSPAMTAIISAHLGAKQLDRVKEYARHLAAGGQRIGLIEVDSSVLRVSCFEKTNNATDGFGDGFADADESFEARDITAAIEELSCDLDRWLLVLPSPRTCEARCLLRDINDWVLLTTCDHDGVVGAYRTIKGLHESSHRPRISLALLDAHDYDEANKIHRKLGGVCEQFLHWRLESESPVVSGVEVDDVIEHAVLHRRPPRDKAQLAIPPQWQVVASFVARGKSRMQTRVEEMDSNGVAETVAETEATLEQNTHAVPPHQQPAVQLEPEVSEPMAAAKTQRVGPSFSERPASPSAAAIPLSMPFPVSQTSTKAAMQPITSAAPAMRFAEDKNDDDQNTISEVLELPDSQCTGGSILAAILRSESAELIECPVKPPMCTEAKLAVTRDRRIVLLAATRQGLGELRSIGRAYNWLVENYALIAMALPQMSIDPAAPPRLRLLVDHADLSAEILQPMLQSNRVTVQAYRRLRWGAKTGLLLEAA